MTLLDAHIIVIWSKKINFTFRKEESDLHEGGLFTIRFLWLEMCWWTRK